MRILILACAVALGGCAGATEDSAPAPITGDGREIAEPFQGCGACPVMVVVPPGVYTMGSPSGEIGRSDDEGPPRRAIIAHRFAVSRNEITRGQFAAFVQATNWAASRSCYRNLWTEGGWVGRQGGSWRDPGFHQDDDHPVVCVTWDDAQAYVRWLNTQTSGGYRLLSEVEWEYAARAGAQSPYPWGASASEGCVFMRSAACDDGAASTDRVAARAPNAFGLLSLIHI